MDNPKPNRAGAGNSYSTPGVLGLVTLALAWVGWIGLFVAAFAVADGFGLNPTDATFWWVVVIGGFLVMVASSVAAGRWAAQQGSLLTPWLLVTNAAEVLLLGGGWNWSGSEPFALMLARNLLAKSLVAVLGWELGAWTVTTRQPNLRLQRPAGGAS